MSYQSHITALSSEEAKAVGWRDALATAMVLFKLRIVALLVFSAVAGLFLGAGGWPDAGALATLLVTGTLSAAGASALNEYLERETDARMRRTKRRRPLATGAIRHPQWVPALGAAMVLFPSLIVLPWNPALAFFLAMGAVIYVGIYTVWLKPRTPLNIVIGGAAGSCAVLAGGAAASAWTDPGVIALATLLFFWTPIHFWSLALVYREDYARAGVPMLPVVTTSRWSAFWALVHGLIGGIIGLVMVRHAALGAIYLIPVALVTAYLWWGGIRLLITPEKKQAWQLFHASNLYLAVILLAVCIDAVIAALPWLG